MIHPNPYDRRRAERRDGHVLSDALMDALAIELAEASLRDEVGVLFQPQVRIADDRITGVEALARWNHPSRGPLGADLLFAAAARGGMEGALSDHVRDVALATVAAWPTPLDALGAALNVTAGDLARPDFAATLLDRVKRSGLSRARLTVEITETAPIDDLRAAASSLARLREAGMKVAIDDFGTGYTGFAWLQALPFDRLKIDKSFIGDIAASPRARKVVRGMVALANALDLDVVAEGVETDAQRRVLADEGCGWFQGFLCAGALDTAGLTHLVESRS